MADQIRPRLGNTAASILALGGFVNIFVAVFTLSNEAITLYFILQAVLVGILSIGVWFWVMYELLKKRDIPNYLRLFIVPLLVILNEEMAFGKEMRLRFDLRRKDRQDNITHTHRNFTPNAKWISRFPLLVFLAGFAMMFLGLIFQSDYLLISCFFAIFAGIVLMVAIPLIGTKYPRIIHTIHAFPWLEVQARLHDGANLDLQIEDEVNRFLITQRKRGSSGKTKIKTKTKYKIRTHFRVRLALPTDKYDLATVPASVRNREGLKMKSKRTERRDVIRLDARQKSKDIKAVPDFRQFLYWVADAYRKFEQKKASA
ncbi:MAG: hypothetical protein HC913_04480 [Microscillaceae bacterium]|nr:hypothetical protein [Microscillaceae bacterium]